MNTENQIQVEEQEFAQWYVLSLMGHVTYAGFVENVQLFGKPMIKLSVPQVTGDKSIPPFVKFISPNSIYDLTPVDEAFAIRMSAKLRKAPIEDYAHNEVIKELAQDYVKNLKATEVAQILLNQNEPTTIPKDFEVPNEVEDQFL